MFGLLFTSLCMLNYFHCFVKFGHKYTKYSETRLDVSDEPFCFRSYPLCNVLFFWSIIH